MAWQRWGVVAFLFALAMRLAVPAGFMWAPASDGAPQLIPCFGTAPSAATAAPMDHGAMAGMAHMAHASSDARHHSGDHDDNGAGSHECAFAALGGLIDLGTATNDLAAPLLPAAAAPLLAFHAIAPGRGLAAPPPPSRGPPATL